ncbi:MAG: VIT and VWA domain-containing protein [Verrucomicrobia bacterium]|nr:VIT and VWA domain-containing protein [Verrucomicrobiota bacterium]
MRNQNIIPNDSTILSIRAQAPRLIALVALAVVWVLFANDSRAAGTLSLKSSSDTPLEIRDHHVDVTINNGFARTEVTQTFYNSNQNAVEGLYTFPVPEHGSLSEVSIYSGETELQGEVVEKVQAESIYESETAQGNQAGLTQKEGYQDFEFWIAPIHPLSDVRLRFVYYEPLVLDHGVGRYLYPLEEGGTDEVTPQFWSRNAIVSGNFSIEVDLKSAWPVADIRTPGYTTTNTETASGVTARYVSDGGSLESDFVFYYRLEDNLPGRVELIPYKETDDKPGTFMLVVTPGIDLQPLDQGTDYIFVLDVSGSMGGKLGTLVSGVKKTLKTFRPEDRFRIILFNNQSDELTKTWVPATAEQVDHAIKLLDGARSGGGTNIYAGLKSAFRGIDNDRVTNLILVTDGVTNTGIVNPKRFEQLMQKHDIRFFGFLLGNHSNWPLMKTICDATGGFYQPVSNSDDIIGQIMLAKGKVLYESIHDFDLRIKGVDTFDVSPTQIKKVFRGQQLVFFGRYAEGGEARLEIETRISGQKKYYTTVFNFPDIDTSNPEIERLWALNRIETLEQANSLGKLDSTESDSAITDLAVQYQLVTDYTSMIVLTDEQFQRHGIDRRNQARIQAERAAQIERNRNPVTNRRVDSSNPAFQQNAPRPNTGGGAGAISPWFASLLVGLLVLMVRKTYKSQKS